MERWLNEIREELDRYGPGYFIEITGLRENLATAILRNKHGAYFLVSGDITKSGNNVSVRGPYDKLVKLPDGNYLGENYNMGLALLQHTLDPTGEILHGIEPDPLSGRHFGRRYISVGKYD